MILLLKRKPHILIGSRQFKKILQHVQSAGGLSVWKLSSKGKLILQGVRDHPKSRWMALEEPLRLTSRMLIHVHTCLHMNAYTYTWMGWLFVNVAWPYTQNRDGNRRWHWAYSELLGASRISIHVEDLMRMGRALNISLGVSTVVNCLQIKQCKKKLGLVWRSRTSVIQQAGVGRSWIRSALAT